MSTAKRVGYRADSSMSGDRSTSMTSTGTAARAGGILQASRRSAAQVCSGARIQDPFVICLPCIHLSSVRCTPQSTMTYYLDPFYHGHLFGCTINSRCWLEPGRTYFSPPAQPHSGACAFDRFANGAGKPPIGQFPLIGFKKDLVAGMSIISNHAPATNSIQSYKFKALRELL